MKRILSIMLALALLLCGTVALAESESEVPKTTIGTISINGAFSLQGLLPEGYTLTPYSVTRDQVIAIISSEDPEKPIMTLSVAFDETYADVERMNDLTDEDFAYLESTFYEMDPTVEISYDETGLGTRLLIARQTEELQDYFDILSIYKGYFVEFVMTPNPKGETRDLTDEQLQMCIDFLTELDFVTAIDETPELSLANTTWTAILGSYDEEANTLEVRLRAPVELSGIMIDSLDVGDSLIIGTEYSITVDSITREDGEVTINDEFVLTKGNNGNYIASSYDYLILKDVASLNVALPDSMVFEDDIEPESLEPVDNPADQTKAEFLAILTNHENSVDPGFAADNVQVTFDENGDLARITRVYVPWQ